MSKTIEVLQSATSRKVFKYVCLIEGIGDFVLSDASQEACEDALSGTDWDDFTRVECFVELANEQRLEPFNPFLGHGRCRIRAHDPTDDFATYVHRRLSGAETALRETITRDAQTITVADAATNFPASGEAHIGTECFEYSSVDPVLGFSLVDGRGKYSPFGTDSTGSGGDRFGSYHRVNVDSTHTQLPPLVTQLPRQWLGRRVGVWMHTVDSDGVLNSKADAQLVYAGRIASIQDDPDSFHTIIDLEHLGDTDIKNATIGRDMFRAEVAPGMYLREGRAFLATDTKAGTRRTANELTVVSGSPGSVNEIQQGYYTASELCDRLNAWVGNELAASRLYGHYNWQSPVSSGDGLRTKCYVRFVDAGTQSVTWEFHIPGEAAALLGLVDTDPTLAQGRIKWPKGGAGGLTNTDLMRQGEACPFDTCVFRPAGPGSHAQEFAEVTAYATDNHTGQFIDQYDLLPYAVRSYCDPNQQWGIFLLDERIWMVAAFVDSNPLEPYLTNAFLAPFTTAAGANDSASSTYIGRRLDEPEQGPVTIRQVLVLESTFKDLMLQMAYSSGVEGYNHDTYDTLDAAIGWGMPGGLLGPEFERSLENIPESDAPMVVVIDEPTKFVDLFHDDLAIRWLFLRWRDQGFEFGEWKTPVASMAAKSYDGTTLALTEANKAEPAGAGANHRIASIEDNEHIRPVIKIDYCRDFGTERNTKYLKSITIEDQRASDDAGGGVKPMQLKMRHTFAVLSQTGTPIERLTTKLLERLPLASKAGHRITRTIDLRYWEGYAPGDIALVTDSFARDPITGARSIASRPALIVCLKYSPGGPSHAVGKPREMRGEVELMFLDIQRGTDYAPAAEIDETYSSGSFSAGYHHASATIRLKEHAYSHDITGLDLRRGDTTSDTEDYDYLGYPAGSKIHIVERDPADPANPIEWERTVDSAATPHQLVLTAALSAPAWDATKAYRIVPQKYSQVVTAQQDVAYQGDEADELVEDDVTPWHYSVGGKGLSQSLVDGTEKAELIPDVAYGDGRPYDPGYDHALCYSYNGFIDYKSKHQSPFLVGPGMPIGTAASTDWELLFIRTIFLGTENPTSTITRALTVAPTFRSALGADVEVRVSIGRTMPETSPGVLTGIGTYYQNPTFTGPFSQTASWSTSSTTEQIGAAKTLDINCKDLNQGFVFLIVEVKGDAYVRGLAQCFEGPRVA